MKYRGYIGTYTKGDSKGIYTFVLDTESGKISDVNPAAELGNPTYLNISKDNRYLFSVIKKGQTGGVAAYTVNVKTGELTKLNDQVTEGSSPCHISVDSQNQFVVTANYHKGTVDSYKVNQDGSLSPSLSTMKHAGSGPNKDRQEEPHVHFAGYTPDENYVVTIDLGTDEIITYALNDGRLEVAAKLEVKPGSGPRHIDFHPSGKHAYVMTELSSEVIVLDFYPEEGKFVPKQYISTLPDDFDGHNDGSAIHVSSDGKFVYAANRGHNSIALYQINEETGELTFVEHTSTEGDWPRDFMLDPSERFIVASNQNSGDLALFSRDQTTGKIKPLQTDIKVPAPVCVKFLHV